MMQKPKLMGILNVTPDSFYEGSRYQNVHEAVERGLQLEAEGADILDIGGESSRPVYYTGGSSGISEAEEIARILPVIKELKKKLTIPMSIDTRQPGVAKAAVEAGVSFINDSNDITGFSQLEMVRVARDTGVEVCVVHTLGNAKTMQENPQYPGGVVPFLFEWFKQRISFLTEEGIKKEKIFIDPGIGFGKTVAHNLEIIHNLPKFKQLGCPLLLGVSRKWFLSQIVNKPTQELLAATLAANAMAISNQADMIRVHDVKEHRSLIDFLFAYQMHKENTTLD